MRQAQGDLIGVMQVTRIGGPDDPRVASYRNVSDAERLRAHGLFVAEGRFVVERLIEGGRFRVRSLLLNDAAWRALEPICARLESDVEVYLGSPRDFEDLDRLPRPSRLPGACRTSAARVDRHDAVGRAHRSSSSSTSRTRTTSAASFAMPPRLAPTRVLLSPATCDPLYRKAIRTSMAATLQVPFATLDDGSGAWPAALARLRRHGFSWSP